jgi:hypothetical protein
MPSTARSQLVTSIQSWATLLQLTLKIPLHTKIQQFLPEVVLSPCDNLPFYKHPSYTFCNRPILKCSPTNQNPRSPICSKSTLGSTYYLTLPSTILVLHSTDIENVLRVQIHLFDWDKTY